MPAFRRLILAVAPLALLLVAASVVPGACRLIKGQNTPDDPADDVSVCRQDAWISQGGQKLGNLAAAGAATYPSWDDTVPTGTLQSGAGASTVTHWGPAGAGQPNHEPTSFIVEGKMTGNLDNLAATLYLSTPVDEAAFGAFYPHLRLTIDGQVAYEAGDANDFNVPLIPVSDGIVAIKFALTGMYDGLAQANDPTKEHTLRLLIRGWTYGDEAIFLYDAGDVPAGFVFNIEQNKLGSYTQFPLG